MKGFNEFNSFIRILILASLMSGISACGGGGDPEPDVMTDPEPDPMTDPDPDLITLEGASEEGGVLKLTSTLTTTDTEAGNYRVTTRVGNRFLAVEPVTENPLLYIESDITAISIESLDSGSARVRIDILNDLEQYYMSLGIGYGNGAYNLNAFIEREDDNGLEELQTNAVADFNGVTIEENKTYNFKLELQINSDPEKVNAYIDGVKALEWILPDAPDGEEGETSIRAYAESRAASIIDETTNTGVAGTSLEASFDNLIIHLDGETLLSDNFDDNKLSNSDISYTNRSLKAVPE